MGHDNEPDPQIEISLTDREALLLKKLVEEILEEINHQSYSTPAWLEYKAEVSRLYDKLK